jgi:5-methylthioadenosine/S-adenosylhomocysteine deaminase
MMQQKVNLIITGRWLVRMDGSGVEEESGLSVAVAGERIAEIGLHLTEKYPQAEVLSCPQGLIMPGLINTHTHAAMSCFRGLADDLPLMEWLTQHIFPREAQLTKEIVYHSTLLSLCEMIRSGTTTFNDMYLFSKEVAAATHSAGMRAWLGEGFFDFPSPNYGTLDKGFVYAEELFSSYEDHDLIRITVNPHAVYTCGPDLLQRAAALAQHKQALLHIHLAETSTEVQNCQERYGCTPVQHLENLGLLDQHLVAAHCVHLSEADLELLVRRQVKVSHCPESNMKLASGIAPVQRLLAQGVSLGLGTDGSASNNDVDLFGEMGTAARLHKVRDLDPTAMKAERVLEAATLGGAKVLGAAAEIGSLVVGKKADLIVLNMQQPHLWPVHQPVSHLVYAAKGSDVLHSLINGKVVLREGRITTLDEAAILAEMEKIGAAVRRIGEAVRR